jgi:putative transposase
MTAKATDERGTAEQVFYRASCPQKGIHCLRGPEGLRYRAFDAAGGRSHHQSHLGNVGCPTREAARQDVFAYTEFSYNPKRKHTNNGMLSPVDYEIRQQKLKKAGV